MFTNEIQPRTIAFIALSFFLNCVAIKLLIGGAVQADGVKPGTGSTKATISSGSNVEQIVFADLENFPSNASTTYSSASAVSSAAGPTLDQRSDVFSQNQFTSAARESESRIQDAGLETNKSIVQDNSEAPRTVSPNQFSFDGMPQLTSPVPGNGGHGLFSRPPDVFQENLATPGQKQLLQSRRIQAQARVTETLSKIRDSWIRNKFRAACVVLTDPDWNQFFVDCEPEQPAKSELVFLLSNQYLRYSENGTRKSWKCIKIDTGNSSLQCQN